MFLGFKIYIYIILFEILLKQKWMEKFDFQRIRNFIRVFKNVFKNFNFIFGVKTFQEGYKLGEGGLKSFKEPGLSSARGEG